MDQRVEAVAVESMPEWMREVMDGIIDQVGRQRQVKVRRLLGSSNELLEMIFDQDRTLMVKRGREEWAQSMFDTAEAASRLLHTSTDLAAPRPLPLEHSAPEPLQAYWRIQLPTLGELWPGLEAPERMEALRSLGGLLRAAHRVTLPGWGGLLSPDTGEAGLERYLRRDLAERLLPAVYGSWSDGVQPLEQLLTAIPAVAARIDADGGVLSHGDMHIQNVLCRTLDGGVRAVGVLDLDNARALPPEADLASFQVLHGPLFNQELEDDHHAAVDEGYGRTMDPAVLQFFRASHLCNLGFHSAMVGDEIHAGWVADALAEEVAELLATLVAEDRE